MLELALFIGLFALFPLLPPKFGATPEITRRLSASTYAVGTLALFFQTVRRFRPIFQEEAVSRVFIILSTGIRAASFIALSAAAIGWAGPAAAGVYFGVLMAYLVLAGLLFIRLAASLF